MTTTLSIRSVLVPVVVLLSACAAPPTETELDTAAAPDDKPAMFGGCILAEPLGDEYPPFTKKMMVYGLLLVAEDDASDEFMQLVARAIEEHFPADETLDLERQAEILRNQYRYRSVIPVPVGNEFDASAADGQVDLQWTDTEKVFDPEEVYGDAPNPTKL